MLCCLPQFRPLLKQFDLESLERHSGSIVGLFADHTIGYLNPAWYEFAHANRGSADLTERWDLGDSMLLAIGRELLPFYLQGLGDCQQSGKPWQHEYECSSADTLRRFQMKVYPLSPSGELLIVHSLLVEQPHDPAERQPAAPLEVCYRNPRGMIAQCPECRRCQSVQDRERWDWVPDWVRCAPANVEEKLCPVCRDYYYPAE